MEKLKANRDFSGIDPLFDLVKALRGEDGCPWDRKQTPQTMVRHLVEEVYELLDAVESEDFEHIREELGDVLFLIVFLIRLFEEQGRFGLQGVVEGSSQKMIRRHPHVFGNDRVSSADEVKQRWHEIKKTEKHPGVLSVLDSVPSRLPALLRASQISERAARSGFDWDDISGVMQKVEEEWSELKTELNGPPSDKIGEEYGDVLFALVNVARFANVHPETALSGAIRKFEKRFKYLEKQVFESGKPMESFTAGQLDQLWEEAKGRVG